MAKKILLLLAVVFSVQNIFSQELPDLKIKTDNFENGLSFSKSSNSSAIGSLTQVKKRKAVNMYFGAGYSFMILTDDRMRSSFPVFDTRNASFLTDINIFFGIAVAKAVTLEIEPSIMFTSNTRQADFVLSAPRFDQYYNAHSSSNGLVAIPIVLNARFFPLYKLKTFLRLFFIGAGGGMEWIREENDVYYNNNPNTYYYGDQYRSGESTSQWAPVGRAMIGFTGSGGMFGFGGEVRYNYVPLKQDLTLPFATRQAKNFNSVDLSLRFYFSL